VSRPRPADVGDAQDLLCVKELFVPRTNRHVAALAPAVKSAGDRLAGRDALHRARLESLRLDDLEAGGPYEGQLAAGHVLAGGADGEPLDQPLQPVDGRPATVVTIARALGKVLEAEEA
jgi:hypothetical protein